MLAVAMLLTGGLIVLVAITVGSIVVGRRPSAADRRQLIRNQALFAQMRIAQATRLAVQQMNDLAREHMRRQQGYRD
jgi:hypothetical protein